MSVTITTLEAGRRLKLTNSFFAYFENVPHTPLSTAGYKGGHPENTHGAGNAVKVPAGAGFIVCKVDLSTNSFDGWMVWRDEFGTVNAGYGCSFGPDDFDSVRGLMRLPGEPKPGEGQPPKQDGGKGLSAEARSQVMKQCPKCKSGTLIEKTGRFGQFVGCDGFPRCDFIWKAEKAQAEPKAEQGAQADPIQTNPKPQPQPQPQNDDAEALAEILRRIAGNKAQPIDADAVRKIVLDELQRVQPGKVEYHIKLQDQEPRKLQSRPHKLMPEVLRRAQMKNHKGMRLAQLLVGEAGTGKSTLCENVAEALDLPFVYVSCSGGMTESKLVGRITPNLQNGEEKYTATPLVNAWEFGGVVLVDEIDAADPNVLLVLNGMMEATFWTAPDGRNIQRHADFILLAAANTYGQGADRKYVGRNQLDAAFLDRWLVLTVDYDTDLEASLVTTSGLAAKWIVSREKIRSLGMRRTLSTRSLLRADMLANQLGYAEKDAIIAATEGWTQEERSKVALV